LLAAPADVDAPVVSRRFLATVELAIQEALGHAAVVRRPSVGSLIAWYLRTPLPRVPICRNLLVQGATTVAPRGWPAYWTYVQ